MEHVIVSSPMDHLENNILSPRQHGFRPKRSRETQLLEFMEELIENMEACKQTDIVIMDFAKAFDKVNHSSSCINCTTMESEAKLTDGSEVFYKIENRLWWSTALNQTLSP